MKLVVPHLHLKLIAPQRETAQCGVNLLDFIEQFKGALQHALGHVDVNGNDLVGKRVGRFDKP